MELKTLKDFKKKLNTLTKWEYYSERDLLEELKAEAVKRFKYWVDFKDKQDAGQLVNEMQILGRLAELKDFFNITKEDLK